jgi:hypothetical protein
VHKDTLIAAVYAQREATLRRVATLPDRGWDLPCPVPATPEGVVRLDVPVRRVRDLVAHLIVVDELVLRGGPLRSWMNLRRLGSSGTWDPHQIRPLAQRSPTDLVTLLARRGERFAQLAAAAPAAVGHLPLRGPFGRQPLLHTVARRVVHEWLHERDLGVAQGLAAKDPARVVGEAIADTVLSGLPATTLPHLALDRGVVRLQLTLEPDGPTPAPPRRWSVDFARRQYGPRVTAAPDATVCMTATALGLLATHRATPAEPDLGLRIDGDADLAGALLDAITMPPVHDEMAGAPERIAAG